MILVWKVCLHSNERSHSWKNRHLSYTPSVAGGMSGADITLPLTCLLDRQKLQPLAAVNENIRMDQFHKRSLLELEVAFPFQKYRGELEMLSSPELRQKPDIFETFANL